MDLFINHIKAYRRSLFLVSGFMFILLVSILTFSFNIGYKMSAKYTPLVNAIMAMKTEVSLAHLWLEEHISGDETKTIEDVVGHLDKALWYANVMLHGGEDEKGVYLPLENKLLEIKVEKLLEKVKLFKIKTHERHTHLLCSDARSEKDKAYDLFFKGFLEDMSVVEDQLHEIRQRDLHAYENTYYQLIVSIFFCVLLIFLILYRNKKEMLINLNLLSESNQQEQKLQESLKELNDSLEDKVEAQVHEVKKSNELFEMIFNTTNNAICIVDLKSNFLLINNTFEKITGFTKNEVSLGLSGINLLDVPKKVMEHIVNKGHYYSYERSCISKEGNVVQLKMDLLLMPDKKSILIVARNVTKKKAYKKERKQQENYLLQQSRMAQMGEMVSMIAHQWRQPLAAISVVSIDLQMQLELEVNDLSKKEEREKHKQFLCENLKHIDTYVHNLSSIIDDFRNFYKPDKETSLEKIEVPIIKAVDIVRASFAASSIQISESYLSENMLLMHENKMMHVVLNILKNAQDNFKEKKIGKPRIEISTYSENKQTVLEICDNGGGIDDVTMKKIFEPYFSTKDEKNGTGLGLHMSRIIIETHHHGKLSAYNKDKGVCFRIELSEELQSDISEEHSEDIT